MMRRVQLLVLTSLAAVVGCAVGPAVAPGVAPALVGQIEPLVTRQVAATTAEVANGATVSLIDPVSGNTLATTLSTPTGQFVLTFPAAAVAPGSGPYFLEASKGLGTSPNQAGASSVRLRTLIRMRNDEWESLSSNGLFVGRSTTALCILSSLKGLNNAQNVALLKTLIVGNTSTGDGITSTDTFTGTPAVTTTEYLRAWDLVYRALDQNTDPVGAFMLRPNATASLLTDLANGYGMRDGFAWQQAGLAVSALNPTSASAGSTVTLHGHGLGTGLSVRLNGLSCPVLTINGTTATFRVPAGATSGNLEVRMGPWIHRSLTLTVL